MAHELTQPRNIPNPEPAVLCVLGVRHIEPDDQVKHSSIRRKVHHAEKYDLRDSLSDATKTDTQQPDMDSDPRKTCDGVAQAGPDYTSDYTVTAGAWAWPHIDFHLGVAVQLEATNLYGLHLAAPFYGAMGGKLTLRA